jgi:matrix metalloproteinase-14 (membrane-inserted)
MTDQQSTDEFVTKWGPLGGTEPELRFAKAYLEHFGYLEQADGRPVTIGEIQERLKDFQAIAGIPETGVLDAITSEAFTWPRCNITDHEMLRRRRRGGGSQDDAAAASGSRWTKKVLTYRIQTYLPKLQASDMDALVDQAFQDWENVSGLQITRVSSGGDMVISIGRGRQDGFDGPGSVLAWAQLPNGSNRQLLSKFDADENWVTNPRARGILFRAVACHEFGHFLGLEHSSNSSALMAPFYNVQIIKPQANDDISRIQRLYGKPTSQPTPTPSPSPTPTPTPTPVPTGGDKFYNWGVKIGPTGLITGWDLGPDWIAVRR